MQIFTCKGVKSKGFKIYEYIYGICPISRVSTLISSHSPPNPVINDITSLFCPHTYDGGIGDCDDIAMVFTVQ